MKNKPYLGQPCKIIKVATSSAGRTLYGLKLAGQTGCHSTSWDNKKALLEVVANFRMSLSAI